MMQIFNLTNVRRAFSNSPVPFVRLSKLIGKGLKEVFKRRKRKQDGADKNTSPEKNDDDDGRQLVYKY